MKTTTLLLITLALFYAKLSSAQAGNLDSSFNKDGIINKPAGVAKAIAIQPDGKIIAAGQSPAGFTLVRYTQAGYIDKSFGVNGVAYAFAGTYAIINSIAIKPSGKIIAAGTDYHNFAIAKFNANGSLDSSFGNNGQVTTNFLGGKDEAYSVSVQPDNKIIAAGTAFDGFGGETSKFAVARYNADGSLDSSFNYDGKVAKYVSAGGFDNGRYAILQPGGKIVVIGNSDADDYPNHARFTLVRFTAKGNIDSSFGTNGFTYSSFGDGYYVPLDAAVQTNGKIVLAGFALDSIGYQLILARYTVNGKLDSSFGVNGIVITNFSIYTFNEDSNGNGLTIQSDDKILIAGAVDTTNRFAVFRFTKNGKIDSSFGKYGYVAVNFGSDCNANDITTQANGKIVVAGKANGNFAVVRLNNDDQNENVTADNISLLSNNLISPNIKVFPNPVKNVLHITGIKSAQTNLSVFNTEGKLVLQTTAANQTCELNIQQLPAGTYYLQIKENLSSGTKNRMSNIKFVKE